MRQQRRLFEIDMVKAIAILTVVLIHANDSIRDRSPHIARVINNWTGFAVPLFILTSGFLFDKSASPAGATFWKVTKRIIGPYIICSLLMLLCRASWLDHPMIDLSEPFDIFMRLLTGSIVGIYYFVPLIYGLYLFSIWLRHWYVVAVRFLYIICLVSTLFLYDFRIIYYVSVVLLFYLTGWLLSMYYERVRDSLQRHTKAYIAVAVVADIVCFTAMTLLNENEYWHDTFLFAHSYAIFLVIICASLSMSSTASFWKLAVLFLSKASYSIYLLHYPILRAFQYRFLPNSATYVYETLCLWVVSCAVTALMILLLKRLLRQHSFYVIGC